MLKKILISIILSASLINLGSMSAYAASCGDSTQNANNYNYQSSGQNCPPTLSQIGPVIVSVVEAIIAIGVVVFFFMLVINGFNFITSAGSPDKIESARKGLVFTVIGFGLLFGSFLIINIISHFTGLSGGFSVGSDGSIHFNILSTFTATPPTNIPTFTPVPSS